MNRRIVVGRVTLGALAVGLVPLAAAGAGASADNSAGLCRSAFGERGPTGGPIVGEAPPGDPMTISVGWNPGDWPDGTLGRIVTCVSLDAHAAPWMTNTTVAPPNTGSLVLNLTLPDGAPGSLVCGQNLLVGDRTAAGRTRPTSPVCFKLRAPEPASPPARSARSGAGRTVAGSPPAGPAAGGTTPAIRPAPTARTAGPPAPATASAPASTPPARAAHEAPGARRPSAAMPDELARSGAALAPAAASAAPAGAATPPASAASAAKRSASAATRPAAAAGTATAGAPATALPRTGLENRIPLAGAGGLLALGGASIIFGTPGRRRRTA